MGGGSYASIKGSDKQFQRRDAARTLCYLAATGAHASPNARAYRRPSSRAEAELKCRWSPLSVRPSDGTKVHLGTAAGRRASCGFIEGATVTKRPSSPTMIGTSLAPRSVRRLAAMRLKRET